MPIMPNAMYGGNHTEYCFAVAHRIVANSHSEFSWMVAYAHIAPREILNKTHFYGGKWMKQDFAHIAIMAKNICRRKKKCLIGENW